MHHNSKHLLEFINWICFLEVELCNTMQLKESDENLFLIDLFVQLLIKRNVL
jgi:hypothetical protein